MSPALDHHAIVADILMDGAAAVSTIPAREVLVLAAHGPNSDAENAAWIADMAALSRCIAARVPYARVLYTTVRDDAADDVRAQATAALRAQIKSANDDGYRVLVTPLLLWYGGIENGWRQRLDGLSHAFAAQALLPDPRLGRLRTRSAAAVG